MDPQEILAQSRESGTLPQGWIVLPLLRNKLILGAVGWLLGAVLGLGLFALIAPITIPYNYVHGVPAAVLTTILLVVLLFIGIGSIVSLYNDIRRLMHIKDYLIVITPEDFVKQEGSKIIHVPLYAVRHVTARGTPPPDRTPPKGNVLREMSGSGENVSGFLFGRSILPSGQRLRRSRMRTPTSLAFIDDRTNEEVTIANDASYGDPFMIAALLKQYARSVRQAV